MSTDIAAFVAGLPKVELHLHLVGSAPPDTVLTLARRHPDGGVPTEPDALRAFYAFTDFPHFLDVYRAVNLLVRTAADVVVLVEGIGAELARRAVRYAEVQVTPVRNRLAGIDPDDLAQALTDARATVLRRHGVELGWVFDADGALGVDGAAETLRFALEHRPPGTVGIGLAGAELGVRRADYAAVFRAARDAGLHSAPHAGETTGPATIWSAIRDLGAERIGHGISAAQDPQLMAYLAEHGIPLEISPTSNLRTRAVAAIEEHPLATLVGAGVRVSINSDDPPMFGTTLEEEYAVAARLLDLDEAGVAGLARAAVDQSFLDPAGKEALIAEVDAYAAQKRA